MSNSDDKFPPEYPYVWSPESELSLQEFLTKYKPSMVQDDGTKPWLWVKKSAPSKEDKNTDTAIEEATQLVKEVTNKVEEIKNDESIPVRGSKKKGTKSKKDVREAVQGEATERLKEISVKNGYVSGKWLIFAPTDKVDLVWSTIATSLIFGPLASTSAHLAKVATCPQNETPNYSHVLCLYIPDVYNRDDVTEIMKILLRNHGMNLMGVKSNLYTSIGLDSKHASGIPSTVWKNTALLPDTEIKKLKEDFFSEINAAKNADTEKVAPESASGTTSKARPKLKKKGEEDPFASDEEDKDATVEKKRQDDSQPEALPVAASSSKSLKMKKKPPKEMFSSEDDAEDGEEEKRKAQVAAKKAPIRKRAAASKRAKDDDSDEETEMPRKKQTKK